MKEQNPVKAGIMVLVLCLVTAGAFGAVTGFSATGDQQRSCQNNLYHAAEPRYNRPARQAFSGGWPNAAH